MSTHLLDTNVVSALRRPDRLPPQVRAVLQALPAATTAISVITVEEVTRGIAKAAHTGDEPFAVALRAWAEEALGRLPVLDVDTDVAALAGRIGAERTVDLADRLVAATAAVHDLVLVTRNTADMTTATARDAGLRLLDPWR